MKKVIVFAGTNEGRKICEFLAANKIAVTACVATEYGSLVMPASEYIKVLEGRLSIAEMQQVIQAFDIVIDATHPYAKLVSENIKLAIENLKKEYIRIIRPEINYENVIKVADINEACEYLNKTEGNVLITTGSKELEPYKSVSRYQERLFFRFLPTIEALNECKRLEIKPSNIICMQGPFGVDINKAMLKQIDGRYLVTKEAGQSGGFLEKLEAAKQQDVKVILIGRPLKEEGLDIERACLKLKEMFDISEERFSHFPLFIDIRCKKVVVIGGGKVASRRVETLVRFGAKVTVIAPQISNQLSMLYEQDKISIIKREYQRSDIDKAYMVIIATNSKAVNEIAAKDAKGLNILTNTADSKENCDFFFPAVFSDEHIVGGIVSNSGSNHKLVKEKAAGIRAFLKKGI